jgi:hypothetical protein
MAATYGATKEDGEDGKEKPLLTQKDKEEDSKSLHDYQVVSPEGKEISVRMLYEAKPYTVFIFLRHFL